MTRETFEIVHLKTGQKSLRCLKSGETFHPVVGPTQEALVLHVEQQRLVERAQKQGYFCVWDVGLGAAANAITAMTALKGCQNIEIHSFDRSLAPLEFALKNIEDLAYLRGFEKSIDDLLQNKWTQVGEGIRWFFHEGDFTTHPELPSITTPHAILFDPYSPIGNPDMWTLSVFEKIRILMPKDELSLLSTYSCSTAVRVNLLFAGFHVGIGTGVGEKAQTTLASNFFNGVRTPLDHTWLKRVGRSKNSAPLRFPPYSRGPISIEDFNALKELAHFHQ
jgi:hypothetical protein